MSRRYLRPILALSALCATAAALTSLTGCEGRKIVARVNSTAVMEDEYLDRVQYVRQIPQNVSLDAGGLTLVNMIEDAITDQLAADKKLQPSDSDVKQLADIVERTTPEIQQQIVSKQMTEDELRRQVRHLLELTAIGTEGAKADPAEVQKIYDELKKDPIFPGSYTMKVLFVPDPVKANEIMPQLKATGNFKEAAKTLKLSPAEVANAGREIVMPKKGAPDELIKALEALGPGPFSPEKGAFTNGPVAITQRNPQDPSGGRTIYLIAELIGKLPDETPPLDRIKLFLQQRVLQQTQPQWQMHAQQKVGEFTKTAQIQINIPRYQPLLDSVILAQAAAHSEAPAGGMGGVPGGAVPGGPAPAPGAPGEAAPGGPATAPGGAGAPPPSPGGPGGASK